MQYCVGFWTSPEHVARDHVNGYMVDTKNRQDRLTYIMAIQLETRSIELENFNAFISLLMKKSRP